MRRSTTFPTKNRGAALKRRPARGFTLIEMMVVVTILALMAALVMPNMVAMKRSRDLRDLEASVQRLPREAAEEARRSKTPVALRLDGDALVLERTPADADPTEIKRVTLGSSLTVQSVRQKGGSVDTSSWSWKVYPDGSASAAVVDMDEDGASKSLVLSAEGDSRWSVPTNDTAQGDEDDPDTDSWQAGEVSTRG